MIVSNTRFQQDNQEPQSNVIDRLTKAASVSMVGRRGFMKTMLVAIAGLGASLAGLRPAYASHDTHTCYGACDSCQSCTPWCCSHGNCYMKCCNCAIWCICILKRKASITVGDGVVLGHGCNYCW